MAEKELGQATGWNAMDASGETLIPGFVDPHTHFVFGGYRDHEFNLRLQGASYMEIMEAGGGIAATNRATRETSEEALYQAGWKRLDRMLDLGITTVESKTGYGEDSETEDKLLRVMERLDADHPLDIVRTYMGAHAVPPKFRDRPGAYIDYLIRDGLPWRRDGLNFAMYYGEKCLRVEDSKGSWSPPGPGLQAQAHANEIVHLGARGCRPAGA